MKAVPLSSNIPALSAQRRLGESTAALQQSFERLASGLRINRPGDDAAGLAIATSLNTDARVYAARVRNLNDGISYLNIAEGAIGELKSILMRLEELAMQSANGTVSTSQRQALDREAQELRDEYGRIVGTTEFNGIKLLDGSQNRALMYLSEKAPLEIGVDLRRSSYYGGNALSFDGLDDYVGVPPAENLKYRGGELTIEAWVKRNSTEVTSAHIISKPWNGAGEYNYVLALSGDGRIVFGLQADYSVPGSGGVIHSSSIFPFDEWHHVAATVDTNNNMSLFIDGILSASGTHGIASWNPAYGDSNLPLAIGTVYPYGGGWGGNPIYSFDGSIDEVRISNTVRYTDNFSPSPFAFTSDDNTIALFQFEEGSGTTAADSSSNANNGTLVDGPTWAGGYQTPAIAMLEAFSLLTRADSLNALIYLRDTLKHVDHQLGNLGAQASRLSTAMSTIKITEENYRAAASQILDADIAEESANLVKNQILQQAGAVVLGQANQLPALALKLLQTA